MARGGSGGFSCRGGGSCSLERRFGRRGRARLFFGWRGSRTNSQSASADSRSRCHLCPRIAFGRAQKLAHRGDGILRLPHLVVEHTDVVDHSGIVFELPQPAEIPQRFGMMPGAFMDLGKQGERLRMIRIENQRLLQQSIGGRRVAIVVGIERVLEQVSRLFASGFPLLFRPALLEDLFAAFPAAWLRHPSRGPRY